MSAAGRLVGIVRTGTANRASVAAALRRCGRDVRDVATAAEVADVPLLVLPGVGSFGAATERLAAHGLTAALRDRIDAGRPTLAVCLGFQLLGEASDESPGSEGLGILPVRSRRLPDGVRVPQMGWNRVQPDGSWMAAGWGYFAHSFRIAGDLPPGWRAARAVHGLTFLAAAGRGRVLGCQFHPELSGAWGQDLLRWWLEGGEA